MVFLIPRVPRTLRTPPDGIGLVHLQSARGIRDLRRLRPDAFCRICLPLPHRRRRATRGLVETLGLTGPLSADTIRQHPWAIARLSVWHDTDRASHPGAFEKDCPDGC